MRTAILSALVLLAFSSAARADMSLPGFTSISREVVLEFSEPYPGWTLFAVAGFGRVVRPVSTASPVALSELLGDNYATRRMGVELYAIPDKLLAEIGSPTTDSEWFVRNGNDPRIRRGGAGVLSLSTTVADLRERVVEKYRVTFTGDVIELDLVETRTEWSWPTVVVMGFLSLAIALGGIWLVRRFRHKRITRTTPPSGD